MKTERTKPLYDAIERGAVKLPHDMNADDLLGELKCQQPESDPCRDDIVDLGYS